jgi:hypothetical protein
MWRVRNLFYETGTRVQLDRLRNTARDRHLAGECFFTPRTARASIFVIFDITGKIVGDIAFDALQQTSRKYTHTQWSILYLCIVKIIFCINGLLYFFNISYTSHCHFDEIITKNKKK